MLCLCARLLPPSIARNFQVPALGACVCVGRLHSGMDPGSSPLTHAHTQARARAVHARSDEGVDLAERSLPVASPRQECHVPIVDGTKREAGRPDRPIDQLIFGRARKRRAFPLDRTRHTLRGLLLCDALLVDAPVSQPVRLEVPGAQPNTTGTDDARANVVSLSLTGREAPIAPIRGTKRRERMDWTDDTRVPFTSIVACRTTPHKPQAPPAAGAPQDGRRRARG